MTNYRSSLAFYSEIRDEFLGGKSVRQIALERGMEGVDVLEFLRWLAREYDVERQIRTDQVLSKLMAAAEEMAARVLHFAKGAPTGVEMLKTLRGELNQILATYKELSTANEAYVEHKRRVGKARQVRTNAAAEEEIEGVAAQVAGGGLEAMIFADPPSRPRRKEKP
jgi:hypothetical protein